MPPLLPLRQWARTACWHGRRARIRALALPRRSRWLRGKLGLPANEIFDPLALEPGVRARVRRLDPAATFSRPPPWLPDEDRAALRFFHERRHEVVAGSYVLELEGGIAWGHPTGGVFTEDRRFVAAVTHDPGGAAAHAVWSRVNFPPIRRLAGRVLYLVTPEATDNYHHWLIDLLPRLGLVQRAGFALDEFDHIIVNHAARPYQRTTLAHFGIPAERIVTAGEALLVQADVLVVPSLKADNQTLPAADLAFLREQFLESSRPASPPRRLFLTRRNAAFRRLLNEAELVPLLAGLGFELVTLDGLDVAAQARLFAEAEVVAGPAGAAFANLVFASPGTRVLELTPPQWLSAFHWMISARLGLDHHIVPGAGPVMRDLPDPAARRLDLIVEPARLGRALERLIPAR